MESVDGARSVQAASEDIRNQCDPCNYEGNEKTAVNFCQECKEYLCIDCTDSHRKFTMSRNHRILSAEQVLGQASILSTPCKILCETCKSEGVTHFCEEHHIVICRACRSIQHRKCTSEPIDEKGKHYDEAKLEHTTEKLKSVTTKLEQLLKDRNTDLKQLKTFTETCMAEVKTFRQEINKYLDILEEKAIKELENKESKERKEIELHLSTISATKKVIMAELMLLEDVKKTSMNSIMFAADVKVSNGLKEYEKLLEDIYKEGNSPVVIFKRNEHLSNIKTNTHDFGTIEQNRSVKQNLFPDMSVQSCSKVGVKLEDERSPNITGCDVLPDGQIILCDNYNEKIKLLHSSFSLKESLKLKCSPWDVSVINNNSAVVTLPAIKQLQYIELEPSLKYGRVIQLDKICWGVQVFGESLYVTYHNNPGQGEVRILGLEGNLKKRIGVSQDGSFMFTEPYYLTVSSTSGRIYTSDYNTATVTCIESDGSVVYQYQDNNLNLSTGLCVDAWENIIVCGESSNNVQIITASGKMSGMLLIADGGVKMPDSVAYRHTDNTLIIGGWGIKYLLVCRLIQQQK